MVAIVQARTGSTRLPAKVLKPLAGRPMLEWVLARLARAKRVDAVVVATSAVPADDAVAGIARAMGLAAVGVRITADCPLIDPDLVEEMLDRFLAAFERRPELFGINAHVEQKPVPGGQ